MQTESGIPPVIPFAKFNAACEALGITARGVYRIEITTDCVTVHRIAKDAAGRSVVVGDPWGPGGGSVARILDTIPLSRTTEARTA